MVANLKVLRLQNSVTVYILIAYPQPFCQYIKLNLKDKIIHKNHKNGT